MTSNTKIPQGASDALIAHFSRGEFSLVADTARALLARYPDHGFFWKALGSALTKLGDLSGAREAFQRALKLSPKDAETAKNLGVVLMQLGEFNEACAAFGGALELAPNSGALLRSLGTAQLAINDYALAEASFVRALKMNPNDHETLCDLGVLNLQRGNAAASRKLLARAVEIAPSHMLGWSALLCATCYDMHATSAEYIALANQCFSKVSSAFAKSIERRSTSVQTHKSVASPLRIGFVSADFKNHPVGYFLLSFLKSLRALNTTTYAYSNSNIRDRTSEQLRSLFTHWRDIAHLPDELAKERIDADQIDLLVDLSGHTNGHRQSLFTLHPARSTASWLGYFASTGNPGIDFLIADPISVPEGDEVFFSERIVRMPVSRFCFSPIFEAPDVTPLPALTREVLTFGCLQNPSKLNDETLALWSRVLKQIPKSRILFSNATYMNAQVSSDLRSRLTACGIPLDRIVVEYGAEYLEYLAGYGAIDFILDTSPFTGGTTTCEALWMGVPTLTLSGKTMISRQGEALLRAVGLDDWVARNEIEFVRRAVAASHDLEALDSLRQSLRARMHLSPLCDAQKFARDWLAAVTHAMFTEPPK